MRSKLNNEISVAADVVFGRSGSIETLQKSLSVATTQKPFRPNFSLWAARSYKPLTVFLLALVVLLLCYVKVGAEIMSIAQSATIIGAACVIISILLSPEWTKGAVAKIAHYSLAIPQYISASRAFSHTGSVMVGLAGLILAYANHHSQFVWTIYPTLSLLGGFALGSSLIMLLVNTMDREETSSTSKTEAIKRAAHLGVIPERLDVLAGAVVAGVLLGTTLVEINTSNLAEDSLAAGIVWLPAVLAWCGVGASLLMRQVLKNLDLPATIKRIMSVFVMLIVAYVLVSTLMPSYWVIEGQEKLSSEIFLAAGVGIIGGFMLLEADHGYKWLRTQYYAWVLQKPTKEAWYMRPFRHLFRMVCLTIPVVLVAWFLKQAFDHVGLYGIIIAAVALLSNLNVQFTFSRKISF